MKHVLLSVENTVLEIIPDENPALPGIPLEERYSADFLTSLLSVDNEIEVELNWKYDPKTGAFSEPIADGDPELTDAEALAILLGEAE